jgi:hypothetical protein
MNRLDKKYTDLLQDILDNGVVKMTVLALVRFQCLGDKLPMT